MDTRNLDAENLAAWCIVPYDTEKRTPTERAELLTTLGLAGLVWDWREEHVAEFPAQVAALVDHRLDLFGMWAPALIGSEHGSIDPAVRTFVAESKNAGFAPDLWACLDFGEPGPVETLDSADATTRANEAAEHLLPLVDLAGENDMRIALYNHLGWYGEPENNVRIIERLSKQGRDNVGIVYQQHHGHHHLDRWEQMLSTAAPHLFAIGLNGMVPGAHWGGRKIHPYGHGQDDQRLLEALLAADCDPLVTILCHTMDDAELRLRDELDGLAVIRDRIAGQSPALDEPRIPEPVWPH